MFRFLFAIILTLFPLMIYWEAAAQTSDIPKVITEEALLFNQGLLDDLLKRDTDTVLEKALPEFQGLEGVRSQIEKFMAYLPPYEEAKTYEPFSTEVRITTNQEINEAIYHTRYELTDLDSKDEFTHEWAIVDLYTQGTPEGLKLRHFNFKTHEFQPTKLGKFRTENQSIIHYIFLALLIAMPIFIIFTIVAIIRNKHMTKKWLWGIFSAFGLWGVNFNWITGKISTEFITITSNSGGVAGVNFKLISFQLLGASIAKTSQFSPFIITIALPLGAILYWTLKHRDKTVSEAFE